MSTATKTRTKKTQNLVVPIDTDLKNNVKDILAELGLNQSQLVVALFRQIARTKRVPLTFDLNDSRVRQATPEEAREIDEFEANPQIASEEEVAKLEKTLGIRLSY